MHHVLRLILCVLAIGAVGTLAPSINATEIQETANASEVYQEPVAVHLINEDQSIQPGHPFWVAVQLNIDEHWHAYWKNPGDAGMAPVLVWQLPDGFQVNQTLWPTPTRFSLGTAIGFGYEQEMILLAQITPPASQPEGTVSINAEVRWVVCSDSTCLPGESQASLQLAVSPKASEASLQHAEIFKKARSLIPQKHTPIAAKREASSITLLFNDPQPEKRVLQDAEFYPESQEAIDYTTPAVLQHNAGSNAQYSISLKEVTPFPSLKGILVMHAQNGGTEAYDIDAPISPPLNDDITMNNPVDNAMAQQPAQFANDAHSFEFQGGVALAIVLAFIGGMILNLMPCVLPVISFKILSFVKMAKESRTLIFQHGLAFSFGVLLSFWVLAGLLLILQAYGRAVGWGFQLQEPIFVALLAALLFVFALSLFGLFEIGTSLIAVAGQAQQSSSKRNALIGSFLSGILATAVATPCTGPFLGSAVGFAVTLPTFQALLIFTSLGLGMSLPYLALAACPSLLRFMPKPGPWMIVFKELMGFLMLGTVVWLVWVFSAQTSNFAVSLLLAGFFLLAVACWIYGRWGTPMNKKLTRLIGIAFAIAFFSFGSYTVLLASSSWAEAMGDASAAKMVESEIADVWEEFSPERVAELRQKGIPVFIDFTAKWCLICQANHLVLSGDEVAQKFASLNVVRMKADWTKNDASIAAELRKFGRNSVPLYVLYGADSSAQPEILPQVLTSDTVLSYLKKLEEVLK